MEVSRIWVRNLETKKAIRKRILGIRSSIPREVQEEKSRKICEAVIKYPYFEQADILFCYMDFHDEVQTELIRREAQKRGMQVAVPRVEGDSMYFYKVHDDADLEAGYFGIPEPKKTCGLCEASGNVLMIVPGTVFDPSCNRMGYGKGFYDRYLAKHPGIHTVGIAFSEQIVDELPVEETDWKLDAVITDTMIYRR